MLVNIIYLNAQPEKRKWPGRLHVCNGPFIPISLKTPSEATVVVTIKGPLMSTGRLVNTRSGVSNDRDNNNESSSG